MEDNELEHIGVLGMRWGKSRSPQHLAIKNDKLAKKIIKTDVKAASVNKNAMYYQGKLNGQVIKSITTGLSPWAVRRTKSTAKRLKRLSNYNARLVSKSAKYKKIIYKNEQFVKKLASKTADLKAKDIANGKALVEGSFN